MNDQSTTLFNTSPPPDDTRPVVLLDQTFSSAKIADFLRASDEWRIELHSRVFVNSSIPDHEWVAECGKRGWIAISCDKAIRRSPRVVEAVRRSRAKVFFMGSGQCRAEEYMAVLGVARRGILRIAKQNKGPFFARIHRTGKVELVGLAEHETARQRSARKYKSGAAFRQYEHRQRSKDGRRKTT